MSVTSGRTEWRKKRYVTSRLVSHGEEGRQGAYQLGTPVDGNIGNVAS